VVARDMILQQPFYKLCNGIDLVNDNQYWIVLINNATRECSANLVHNLLWLPSLFFFAYEKMNLEVPLESTYVANNLPLQKI
jgi:hypothetical protein